MRESSPSTSDGVPLLCDPLRKLDCLVTDGGGAIVIARADRAARRAAKTPCILGAGESHVQWHVAQCFQLTITQAWPPAGAFGMAGVKPRDVDVFEPTTILPRGAALSRTLASAPRAAPDFIAGGRLRPGGSLPSMTSGGGCLTVIRRAWHSAVDRSRTATAGEAGARQVPTRQSPSAHGTGGYNLSTASTVVLARGRAATTAALVPPIPPPNPSGRPALPAADVQRCGMRPPQFIRGLLSRLRSDATGLVDVSGQRRSIPSPGFSCR